MSWMHVQGLLASEVIHRSRGLQYRGTSLIRNHPLPKDHCGALDIVLLYDPRGAAVYYERGTPTCPVLGASTNHQR